MAYAESNAESNGHVTDRPTTSPDPKWSNSSPQ